MSHKTRVRCLLIAGFAAVLLSTVSAVANPSFSVTVKPSTRRELAADL